MYCTLQEFSGRIKGFKVDAVDTTGAGDAFVAGILSHVASDFSLIQVFSIENNCTPLHPQVNSALHVRSLFTCPC